MADSYRVCIIMPKGYIHSLCFQEIALLLKYSLNSIGISCDIRFNRLADDRINIILGYHLLRFDKSLLGYRYVPYQLEQLSSLKQRYEEEGWYFENIMRILKNAHEVWDYSRENIDFFKGLDIYPRYLPVGYHERLERIAHKPDKDIDILFYGSIEERRRAILDSLKGRVKVLFGVYGKKRDRFIARSRIILNIHHYSTEILEVVRISYLLNNGCFIVSETSSINPYQSTGMCMVSYENLRETCQYYLKNIHEREYVRNDAFNTFKSDYPMVKFLEDII